MLSKSYRHSEHGYLAQGGSLPVSFASLQYRSLRINAAALGCLCLVKTPFLFPYTRVIPADTSGINKKLVVNRSADTEERFIRASRRLFQVPNTFDESRVLVNLPTQVGCRDLEFEISEMSNLSIQNPQRGKSRGKTVGVEL